MVDVSKDMFTGWDDSKPIPDGSLTVWNCDGVPLFDETTGKVHKDFNPQLAVSSQKNQWRQDEVSASYGISACYDYYKQTHSRKGLDDKDLSLWMHVNTDWDNACYFRGTQFFVFGNGDADFYPFSRSIDVMAHEYGHGIIAFTAKFESGFQSGALNEAYSDFSGVAVERYVKSTSANWLMGDDIVRSSSGYTCLRDLSNPHNSKAYSRQPMTMSEYKYLSEDEDDGGVHVNCTIPGHAMYLISQSIGFQNMETLIYRTFTQYMVPLAQFVDFRLAAVQAAEDLGYTGTQISQIKQAFDDVEIYDGGGTSPPAPYEPVSGAPYVLGVSATNGHMMRLDSDLPYSSEKIKWFSAYTNNKPSISEDGSVVCYINQSGQFCLYYPETDKNSVIESPGLTFHNVALSPKGDYVALIPDWEQFPSTLIIWDLNSGDQSIRTIYIPSGTQGVQVPADYADILDWTNDGGYLIYDCCLSMPGEEYGDFAAWNICLTSAKAETYAVLFSAGNDLIYGNPSVSSTRDYVLAFDIIDFSASASSPNYLMGTYDLANGVFGLIAQNERTYGHPSFSPDDSKIVFQDINSTDEFRLLQIELMPDKLNGKAGTKTGWVKPVKFPVWYATGSRPGGGGTGQVIFEEDFDDWDPNGEFPPDESEWWLLSTNTIHTWKLWEFGFDEVDPNDEYSAYIFYDDDVYQNESLASPVIQLQGGPVTLEFWAYYASTWLGDYHLYVRVYDGNELETIWQLEDDDFHIGWKHFTVSIPSKYAYQEIKLLWNYWGQEGYIVALDGIQLFGQTSGVEDLPEVPENYTLTNYPNPFNPSTMIQFDLPKRQEIRVSVYNIQGQKIEELVHETMDAGRHQTIWIASEYPSGLYFIQITGKTHRMTQKCMLVK